MHVHIPSELLSACEEEASTHFPLESGGTFMGYISGDRAYIEAVIPPGPKAYRGHRGFAPDQEWQLAEIAALYERSGKTLTYLGDWHSHPNASSGTLSFKDRMILRRIMRTADARCSQPIMSILWGYPTSWSFSTWRAMESSRRRIVKTSCVHEVVTHSFPK